MSSALHSRVATGGTDEWITAPEVYDPLAYHYGFRVDLAACSSRMARTQHFLSDSLSQSWADIDGPGWLNPPYSQAARFLGKASFEMERGFTTVALVNVATDTAAWDRHVLSDERVFVRFIPGRVWFIAGVDIYKLDADTGELVVSIAAGDRGPSPHPSAVLVFPGHRDVPPPPGGTGRFGIYRVDHHRPARARQLALEEEALP